MQLIEYVKTRFTFKLWVFPSYRKTSARQMRQTLTCATRILYFCIDMKYKHIYHNKHKKLENYAKYILLYSKLLNFVFNYVWRFENLLLKNKLAKKWICKQLKICKSYYFRTLKRNVHYFVKHWQLKCDLYFNFNRTNLIVGLKLLMRRHSE